MERSELKQKYDLVTRLYKEKRFDEALAIIRGLEVRFPKNPSLVYSSALCIASAARFEEAIEVCNRLITEFRDVRGVDLRAQIAVRQADAAEAGRRGAEAVPTPGPSPSDKSLTATLSKPEEPETVVPGSEAPLDVAPQRPPVTGTEATGQGEAGVVGAAPDAVQLGLGEESEPHPAADADGALAAEPAEAADLAPDEPGPRARPRRRGMWGVLVAAGVVVAIAVTAVILQTSVGRDNHGPDDDEAGIARTNGATGPARASRQPTVSVEAASPGTGIASLPRVEPFEKQEVTFPEDRILGRLFVRRWNAPENTPWADLGAARGTIAVPEGQEVGVVIEPWHWIDLGFFASAGAFPVCSLEIRNSALTDDALAALRGMQDLHALVLDHTFRIGDQGLSHAAGLERMRRLVLRGVNMATDDGLSFVARLPALREFDIADTSLSNDVLAYVEELSSLEVLRLPDGITDDGLGHLTGLTHLRELALGTGIEGGGLGFLSGMGELESVEVRGDLSDDGAAALAALPSLRRLVCLGEVPESALASLAESGSLRELHIIGARLAGQAGDLLADLEHLTVLHLEPVADAETGTQIAARVTRLKEIETLGLLGPAFGDDALAHVRKIEGLRALDLTGATVTEEGLARLGEPAALRRLVLDHTAVGDEIVASLEGMGTLAELSLVGTAITEDGIEALRGLLPECSLVTGKASEAQRWLPFPAGSPKGVVYALEETGGYDSPRMVLGRAAGRIAVPAGKRVVLATNAEGERDLSFLDRLQPDDLDMLALAHGRVEPEDWVHVGRLTGLEALIVAGPHLEDADLEQLRGLKHLRTIDFTTTPITDQGVLVLADAFPSLEELRLAGCGGVSDWSARHIASLSSLRELDLSGTGMTDASLAHLRILLLLEWLDVSDTAVTEAGVAGLRQALPDCEVFSGDEPPGTTSPHRTSGGARGLVGSQQ